MFRKILSVIFAMFMFLPMARGAEMVNVEYIHQYLNTRWGIDLPYNPELTNPKVAANMKYLLTVVDIANEFLNDEQTTDYGNGEYATLAAADTIATNTAIDTLVHGPFSMTINANEFSIKIGAAGNFIIDWGDGKRDVIADKPVGTTTYSHKYTASGEYEINLTGRATDYSDSNTVAAISFYTNASNAQKIYSISGSLGKIFPTLPDGSQPRFYQTFMRASNLSYIPADLFAGISGAPVENMFYSTFNACANLTRIPDNLFSGISGAPADYMFSDTFDDTAITEIPADLFAGIRGAPAERMFSSTFSGTDITEIPADLFAGVRGAPAEYMFDSTFENCIQLQSIPENLFAGIRGAPADYMFCQTFANTALTSVPANLFGELNGNGASNMFLATFRNCANLTTIEGPLFSGEITPEHMMFNSTFSSTAITEIPADLFAGVRGAPAGYMFYFTFENCIQLQSIPENLFAGVQGAPAEYMFNSTFAECTQLQSIPENLFAGISGPAAQWMFRETFADCTSLTGPSARINGQYLYEIWPDIGASGYYTYENATGLSDYDQIPDNWK